MGNGVSGDQGNLPSYGKRDVGIAFDRKQHDWSEPARAQEVNTLVSNVDSYNKDNKVGAHPALSTLCFPTPILDTFWTHFLVEFQVYTYQSLDTFWTHFGS